ncbi:MAG TPA: WXG100 family type VII secretion target [Amycolatopsis sp.]
MPDGYTGADVYARMHRFNGDTSTLDSGQQAAQALKGGHDDLVARITKLQGKLDGSWQGDASQKAQAGFAPLIQSSQQAADDLNRSAESITAQNSGFHETLTKLAPMDSNRPDTNDLASYNPFHASDSEKKAAQWDTNDQANKNAYGSYYATTDGNRNSAAKDYPALNAAPAGLAVAPPPPGGHGTSGTGGTGGTGSTGGPGGTGGTGHGGVPSGHSAGGTGQVGPHSTATGPSPAASGTAPGGTHGAGATPPPYGGTSTDSTSTAGYTPKPPASNAPGFGSGQLPTFGPGSGGGDSGTGGGAGPIGGFGVPGGSGSGLGGGTAGGIGAGTGAGAGSRLGGGSGPQLGNGAGTGSGGPAGQGVARPGGGTAGAPGAKGSSGMGGMGAGAGKGKGGEDEEHERKVTLPDQDADELFGGYPDGMRPTPPTIGA